MCLSTVFERGDDQSNRCLLRNVAKVQVNPEEIVFTDLMGVRTAYAGKLHTMDLLENTIIVSKT